MMTREKIEKVSPMEKFDVLAGDLDQLRLQIGQLNREQSVDDLLDVVELTELAEKYSYPEKLLRKRLKDNGAEVFKIGRKWVIRKVKLIAVYEVLERA